jgi:phosphoglycolate phosphatase
MMNDTRPYPGIPEMLTEIKNRGIIQAVLSNKPDAYVAALAEYYFPGQFFKTMGKLDGIPLKPDPAALEIILNDCGVSRNECVFIGDSSVDIETARNAGIDVIAVSWGFSTNNELNRYDNIAIIDNSEQLLNFIIDKEPRNAL